MLTILEIYDIPLDKRQLFCDLIADLIETDTDYDVRNYAVIASRNFINESNRLESIVSKVALDPQEDIVVKHNACAAILNIRNTKAKKEVLEKLLQDEELGKYAKGDLASIM